MNHYEIYLFLYDKRGFISLYFSKNKKVKKAMNKIKNLKTLNKLKKCEFYFVTLFCFILYYSNFIYLFYHTQD